MNSDVARGRTRRLHSLAGLALLALPSLAISRSLAAAAPAAAQAIDLGTTARTPRGAASPSASVSNRRIQAAESSQGPPAGPLSNSVTEAAARPPAPPAPPTPDMLLGVARRITEGWIKGDPLVVGRHLSDNFVDFKMGVRVDKKGLVAMVGDFQCALRDWKLQDPQTAMIAPNVYVLSYQGTFDGSCKGPDGRSSRMLSPTRAASIFVRDGADWRGAFHSENRISTPPGPSAGRTAGLTKAAGAPPAKDRPEPQAATSGRGGPEIDAGLSAWASKVAPDASTDALVRAHALVWDAVMTRDSKKLAEILSPRVSLVGPLGEWANGREAVLRKWPETIQCRGTARGRVYGGVASSISPGVELLTVTSSANGDCDGRNGGDRFQTAIYVQEGGSWRLAFIFDSIAG